MSTVKATSVLINSVPIYVSCRTPIRWSVFRATHTSVCYIMRHCFVYISYCHRFCHSDHRCVCVWRGLIIQNLAIYSKTLNTCATINKKPRSCNHHFLMIQKFNINHVVNIAWGIPGTTRSVSNFIPQIYIYVVIAVNWIAVATIDLSHYLARTSWLQKHLRYSKYKTQISVCFAHHMHRANRQQLCGYIAIDLPCMPRFFMFCIFHDFFCRILSSSGLSFCRLMISKIYFCNSITEIYYD